MKALSSKGEGAFLVVRPQQGKKLPEQCSGSFLQFAAAQSAVIVTVREMGFAMLLPPKI